MLRSRHSGERAESVSCSWLMMLRTVAEVDEPISPSTDGFASTSRTCRRTARGMRSESVMAPRSASVASVGDVVITALTVSGSIGGSGAGSRARSR